MPADYLRSNAKKSAGERKSSPVSFDFFPRGVFLDFEAKEQILAGWRGGGIFESRVGNR